MPPRLLAQTGTINNFNVKLFNVLIFREKKNLVSVIFYRIICARINHS